MERNIELPVTFERTEMLKEIIRSRFYESDYQNVTQKLLYEDVSYDYAVENGIAKIVKTDLFEYKK